MASPNSGFIPKDGGNAKPMTHEEKLQLSLGLNSLYGNKLKKALNIILTREPSLGGPHAQEFEVNFNTLKPTTLRKLEHYIESCRLKSKREGLYGQSEDEEMTEKRRELEKRYQRSRKYRSAKKLRRKDKRRAGDGVDSPSQLSDTNSTSEDSESVSGSSSDTSD